MALRGRDRPSSLRLGWSPSSGWVSHLGHLAEDGLVTYTSGWGCGAEAGDSSAGREGAWRSGAPCWGPPYCPAPLPQRRASGRPNTDGTTAVRDPVRGTT